MRRNVYHSLLAYCPGKNMVIHEWKWLSTQYFAVVFLSCHHRNLSKKTALGTVHLNWSYHFEKLTLCCVLGVEGSVTAEAETVERMYECELVCFLLCCVLVGSYGNGAW